jgi:hypothetical protein
LAEIATVATSGVRRSKTDQAQDASPLLFLLAFRPSSPALFSLEAGGATRIALAWFTKFKALWEFAEAISFGLKRSTDTVLLLYRKGTIAEFKEADLEPADTGQAGKVALG